ncbi:MAG: hypothetical protein K2K45_07135 [Muribaculaceae bacterium]|nr:hypothetical protein [Muribaculaceae bacterium]
MLSIINRTLEILKCNNEWHERYEGYLSDIWSNPDKTKKGFTKPQGLSVYTTVGDRNTQNYYLRFKGQNVGKVGVDRNRKITLQCLVKESKSHDIKGCPLKYKELTGWDSPKATEFRNFFKIKLSLRTKTKSPEHEVENALLQEFRKRIAAEKVLYNIQPILLHGNFFQMPTPLKASTHNPTFAEHSGGGIDMLARIKTPEGHTRLCVIEIKDENKDSESQKIAMSQAITYATFIAELLTRQPDWMEFFMGHKTKRNRNSRCLDTYDIEVVTIMPEGNTETFQDKTLKIPDTDFRLHCHSLYYNKQKFLDTNIFEFSGTFLDEIKK